MEQSPDQDFGFESRVDFSGLSQAIDRIRGEVGKIIVGQQVVIDQLICAVLTNGHVLIEGVPGVAKTLTAKLLARTFDVGFSRIQFTPDLMPSDILGTSVLNMSKSEFEFKKGPIFSNVILIDEINRAPAKTQAALFEVMEERQVTMDGTTYLMDQPFLVFATQNPVEHEGTYRLPEAQLDRFLFKVEVDYPSLEEEISVILGHHERKDKTGLDQVQAVIRRDELVAYQHLVRDVRIEEKLVRYIAEVVSNTRNNGFVYLGASPRASVAILNGAKSYAAMSGRDFVTPEDIKAVANPVLKHRIALTPEKEMEGITNQEVISQILDSVEIPR